jgi:hypothetical protein
MSQFKTLQVLEDELGEVLKSGMTGESLYYSIDWYELVEAANKALTEKGRPEIGDVRVAGYALSVLGIPNSHAEADMDEEGSWIVYWR